LGCGGGARRCACSALRWQPFSNLSQTSRIQPYPCNNARQQCRVRDHLIAIGDGRARTPKRLHKGWIAQIHDEFSSNLHSFTKSRSCARAAEISKGRSRTALEARFWPYASFAHNHLEVALWPTLRPFKSLVQAPTEHLTNIQQEQHALLIKLRGQA
jgi:hypothetical protein